MNDNQLIPAALRNDPRIDDALADARTLLKASQRRFERLRREIEYERGEDYLRLVNSFAVAIESYVRNAR